MPQVKGCTNCNRLYSKKDAVCPGCGSDDYLLVELDIEEGPVLMPDFKYRAERFDMG